MGLDLQPDGLTVGLAGHCQPDKKISIVSERKISKNKRKEKIRKQQKSCSHQLRKGEKSPFARKEKGGQ